MLSFEELRTWNQVTSQDISVINSVSTILTKESKQTQTQRRETSQFGGLNSCAERDRNI